MGVDSVSRGISGVVWPVIVPRLRVMIAGFCGLSGWSYPTCRSEDHKIRDNHEKFRGNRLQDTASHVAITPVNPCPKHEFVSCDSLRVHDGLQSSTQMEVKSETQDPGGSSSTPYRSMITP